MVSLIPWKRKHPKSEQAGALMADPFARSLMQFRTEFDSLLNRFWSDWSQLDDQSLPAGTGWSISMDETDDAYLASAEAPGFEPEDFQVEVLGNHLRIRAEHKQEEQYGESGRRYQYGRFERMTRLPPDVDDANIEARYHSGMLEIRLPKRPEARGKRIPVQVG